MTTTSLQLSSLPLPPPIWLSDSSNLLRTANPNPFRSYLSSSLSSASSQYTHRRCDGRSRFFPCPSNFSSRQTLLSGCTKTNQIVDGGWNEDEISLQTFGSDEEITTPIPTRTQTLVKGSGDSLGSEYNPTGEALVSDYKPAADVDYLQELIAIQQQGPRAIGFFGTRNMGFMHQELIEILSYAMVITKNHIFTSGASGTNAAVIRGALRAEKPELLTVILPQSLKKQPPESQELLAKVQNVIEKPYNDHLPLIEASRLCNMDIISHVQQVICFAFHDSRLLMETCQEAKNLRKIVTLFYLD